MGTTPAQDNLIEAPINITDAYTGDARLTELDVRANDFVTLLIQVTKGSLTTLTLKPFNVATSEGVEHEILKVAEGVAAAEEIAITLADDLDFALRIDTRGMNLLTLKFKGNTSSGSLDSIRVIRDGSSNPTPVN